MGVPLQRLPRREARVRKKLRLVLLIKSQNGQRGQDATVLDMSDHGLRVTTTLKLTEGQTVYAFSRQRKYQLGNCRVVWAHPETENQQSEAGLEIMK